MAIDDPNPVLFLTQVPLPQPYGPSRRGRLPPGIWVGRAVREGQDATLITYGLGVQWAEQVLDLHPEWDVEVIDLRTLLPWDEGLGMASVQNTGMALVLHEDTMTGGIGAEISARIHEMCFEHLDAPVARTASLDTAFPFAADLERNFMANDRLEGDLRRLLER